MCRNVGNIDRLVRIMFGLGMIFQGVVVGHGTGCILAIAGLVPLISGLVSKCPLYAMLKLNTID
ncbi:MAG: DUF2892 domain-containing protein [Nitrospinota bacterium]|nr:DUF2892 domain-containing protein [Nitrospinota bacterium]